MKTHDAGPFFYHTLKLRPEAPRVHKAPTHETEYPYRHSNSLVLRLRRSQGLVFGRWVPLRTSVDEHLAAALQATTAPAVLDSDGHLSELYL